MNGTDILTVERSAYRNGNSDTFLIGLSDAEQIGGVLALRAENIRRLSEGFFHQMRADLSVLIGSLEMQSNTSPEDAVTGEIIAENNSLLNITCALTEAMESLAELQRLTSVNSRELSGQELADRLDRLLGGFCRWVKDTRGTDIKLRSGNHQGGDFPLSTGLVIDFLFPLMIETMSEMVSSGEITVSALKGHQHNSMKVVFPREIIGHLHLEQVLTRSCRYTAEVGDGRITSRDQNHLILGCFRQAGQICEVQFYDLFGHCSSAATGV